MIDNIAHTKGWLESKRKEFPKRDPGLIEKVIKALTLLEHLKCSGLNFTFKGGTALLLLLSDARRFSIDIDVVLPERPESLENVFHKVIQLGIFYRFEEDVRNHGHAIPKAHYKFFYNSVVGAGISDPYILLDLLFEPNPYTQVIEMAIKSKFIPHADPDVLVHVPSVCAILGDKLTAFAPTTTGIPFGRSKELEIIKQLFDVARLFDEFKELHIVRENFSDTAKEELRYRNISDKDETHVLDDCFDACHTLAYRGERNAEHFKELEKGVRAMSSYIFDGVFNIDEAIVCASKAAYLSRLLRYGKSDTTVTRFDPKTNLGSISIQGAEFKYLNRIKKSKPEGFFYWHQAIELHIEGKEAALADQEKLASQTP